MRRLRETGGAAMGFVSLALVLASACTPQAARPAGRVQSLTPAASAQAPPTSSYVGAYGSPTQRPGRRAARAISEAVSSVPEGSVVVAAQGSKDGNGSWARPFDLLTALKGKVVHPGETVLLRGGVYTGSFVSDLAGTPDRQIVVRSSPGEWAVIDAGTKRDAALEINGSSTIFRDIEVMHSLVAPSRDRANVTPAAFIPWLGIDVEGDDVQLIDLVVHDNSTGIRLRREAAAAQIYGSTVYNNGYLSGRRGHGEGIQIENEDGTKQVINTFVFNNFRDGIVVHGLHGTSGVSFVGNTIFENGAPGKDHGANLTLGTRSRPSDRIDVARNVFYHRGTDGTNVELGSKDVHNGKATVVSNDLVGGDDLLAIRNWDAVDVSENSLIRARDGDVLTPAIELWTPGWAFGDVPVPNVYRWDHNAYSDVDLAAKSFVVNAERYARSRALTFESWRKRTGLDASSRHVAEAASTPVTRVQPYDYEAGRANITVLNPGGARSVSVDLRATGLANGTRFEIRDVQDLGGPAVASGRYDGSKIDVPMRSTRIMQPGGGRGSVSHTPVDFGAFILVPLAG